MNTETTEAAKVITNVFAEEAEFGSKLLVTVVYSDGSMTEKRLSGSVARRYVRQVRAKIGATR